MIYLVIRALSSVRGLLPALALAGLVLGLFFLVYRLETLTADLAASRAQVATMKAEQSRLRSQIDAEAAISAAREAEIARGAAQSADIMRMIDDAKNTDRDAPLAPVARDYLDRLRGH